METQPTYEELLRRVQSLENQIEGKSSEKEVHFEQMLHAIGQAVIVSDLKGTITYWNQAATELYGWKAEEAMGRNVVDVLSAPVAVEQAEEIMARLKQGQKWEGIFSVQRKDLTQFTAHVTDAPLCDASGKLIGIIGVSHDVSAQIQAREQLAKANTELSDTLERIGDAFFSLDHQLRVTWFNAAAERLLGRKRQEVIGKQLFDAFPEARGSVFEENYSRALAQKARLTFETWFDVDPYSNWYSVSVYPSDSGISVYFTITTDRKIYERMLKEKNEEMLIQNEEFAAINEELRQKNEEYAVLNRDHLLSIEALESSHRRIEESESRYRLLYEQANIGIGYFSPEGRVISFNPIAARYLNLKPDDLIGKVFYEIAPPHLSKIWDERFQHALRSDTPQRYEERRALADDTIWFSTSYSKVVDNSGDTIGIQIIATDITQLKQTEYALSESEKRYKALYESAPIPYQSLDENGKLIDVNPAWLRTLGYQRQEIIGTWFGNYLHPDYLQQFQTFFPEFKKCGYLHNARFRLKTKSNDYIDVTYEGCAGYTPEGKFRQTYCTFRDITAELQAKEALLESLGTARNLIDSIPSGLFIYQYVEPDQLYLSDWNPEAEKLTGIDFSLWKNREFNEIWPNAKHAGLTSAYLQVVTTGEHFDTEDLYYQDNRLEGAFRIKAFRMPGNKLGVAFENITQRKRAEQNVREHQLLVQRITEQSPDIIYIYDLKAGRNIFINKNMRELLGYLPGQAPDDSTELLSQLIHPEDIKQYENYEQLTGEWDHEYIQNTTYRLRDASGEWRWFQCREKEFQRNDNHLLSLIGVVTDITSQVEAETALKESETKFRSLFENMNEAAAVHQIITDENGQPVDFIFLDVNPVYESTTRLKKEHIVNRRGLEIIPNLEKRWIEIYGKVALTGESVTLTDHSDYLDKYWDVKAYCPRPGYFAVSISDVTQRIKSEQALRDNEQKLRESEAVLRAMFNNIPFDVWARDNTQVCFLQNEVSMRSWGSLIGKTPGEMGINASTLALWNNNNTLAYRGQTVNEEVEYFDAFGFKRYSLNIVAPILDNDEILGIFGVNIDISERKQFENALREAKDKAEESDRLKTAFLNNVSHEFRTPMNGIVGFSELIAQSGIPDEKRKSYSQRIKESCDRLIDIVTDVIEISQVQSSQVHIRRIPVNLKAEVQEIVDQAREKALQKHIEVRLNMGCPNQQFSMLIDRQKIVRTLRHLIDNAIKFTSHGFVEISCQRPSESELQIAVRDTGIGISAEYQQIIFEPFRQIETSTARFFGGNGIGLSLAKAYIEMMNGKMWLESEVNKGTTVFFTLPIVPADLPRLQRKDLGTEIEAAGKTILLVEDEDVNIFYIKELLADTKAALIIARNGQEAVDYCRQGAHIDLILMDIKMPVMDGYEAASLIKGFRPDIPIVAQTAYALESDREQLLAHGFDDHIAKPIRREALYRSINKYL